MNPLRRANDAIRRRCQRKLSLAESTVMNIARKDCLVAKYGSQLAHMRPAVHLHRKSTSTANGM